MTTFAIVARRLGLSRVRFAAVILIVALLSGCASVAPPVYVTVDPTTLWPDHPLRSLAERVSPLYLPAPHADAPTLTSVLWRPQQADIPAAVMVGNALLNEQHWYVETVFTSAGGTLWLYQGDDLLAIGDLAHKLAQYKDSGSSIEIVFNDGPPVALPLLKSEDGNVTAVTFSSEASRLFLVWQGLSTQTVAAFVRSLKPAAGDVALTSALEAVWHSAP